MVPVACSERELFLRIAIEYFSELNPSFVPNEDWKGHYFETIQSNPQVFLQWILCGEERAGFILFGVESARFMPRKTGVVYELYVAPEFRRRGIARLCASEAIRRLWEFRPTKIQLEVIQGNAGAVALWKSLGFQKVSERFILADNSH
jgi:ribosomal protein S18 acetylase RimI-like enzyme